jgi:flagellar basal body-associated protein FliL
MESGENNMTEEIIKPSKKSAKTVFKVIVGLVILVLVLGGVGGTYYFYTQYQKSQRLLNDPNAASKAESDAVLSKLKKLMMLPAGEQPSIATVLDISKLKDQPFFVNASNGDKVVIYTKAQIAILYSPDKNLIVNVAPVSASPQSSTSPTATQAVKTALYNGTTTTGLTQTAAAKLASQFSSLDITEKVSAAKSDYQTSVVIDLTGKNAALASAIAQAIGANVSALPAGEVAPKGAELLIIVGANYGK